MKAQVSRTEIVCDECENVNWCPKYADVIIGMTFDGKPHVQRVMVCRYCGTEIPGFTKDIDISKMKTESSDGTEADCDD